jgi:hypothetical protein
MRGLKTISARDPQPHNSGITIRRTLKLRFMPHETLLWKQVRKFKVFRLYEDHSWEASLSTKSAGFLCPRTRVFIDRNSQTSLTNGAAGSFPGRDRSQP